MRSLVHVWSMEPGARGQSTALNGTSHDHAWQKFAQVSSHFGWLRVGAPGGAATTWERCIAAGQLVVEARLPVPGTPRGSGAS